MNKVSPASVKACARVFGAYRELRWSADMRTDVGHGDMFWSAYWFARGQKLDRDLATAVAEVAKSFASLSADDRRAHCALPINGD